MLAVHLDVGDVVFEDGRDIYLDGNKVRSLLYIFKHRDGPCVASAAEAESWWYKVRARTMARATK